MLYLLQFACLIFMFISAFFIAATRLHVRWINRRYECSRWMIFSTLLFMGVHYFLQMYCGFRAMGENVGAVINMLVYMPSFTLISMAIYNIEATHMKRRNMLSVLPYTPPCFPSSSLASLLPALWTLAYGCT